MSSGDGVPRGTVTFLFADIEGSTRLWEEQPEFMTQALAVLDRLVRSAVDDSGGYVFATGGDSYAVAFETAHDAVGSALAIQQSIGTEFVGTPRISLRMGVHSGEADERDGDYFGPPVNRAARIMSVGHGGQVLVSRATHDIIGANLPTGASLVDLGEHHLKDLSSPEQLFQLAHSGLMDDFPRLRSRRIVRNNLPTQPNEVIGRDEDVIRLQSLVLASRIVTLSGPGGTGKTRLALEVGGKLLEKFSDGVWLVELAPIQDPSLLPDAVVAAMGLRSKASQSNLDLMIQHLAVREALLVLDNCEHLVQDLAELAARIVSSSANVHLLVTGRERLRIRGETVYAVRALPVPDPGHTSREEIESAAAVRLFVERVRQVDPEFVLTEGNAGFVAKICARLDGLPLALELAAARMLLFDPEQLLGRLDDRFRVLAGGGRDRLAHHRTLEATLAWSYDLLLPTERNLLDRLAVFSGPFDLACVESICVGGEIDEDLLASAIYALADKSLISIVSDGGGKRFVLLETVRAFLAAHLRESGEDNQYRRRHAEYFAAFVEGAFEEMWGRDEVSWLDRLERDYLNLRQAVTWSFDHGCDDLAARISGSMMWFAYRRHHQKEVDLWMRKALDSEATDSSPSAVLRLLIGVGASTSDHSEAIRLLGRAVDLADALGMPDEAMAARHTRAEAFARQGDVETAIQMEETDLAVYRSHDFYKGVALSAVTLSDLLAEVDLERCISLARESIAAAQRWQSPRIEFYGWNALRTLSLRRHDLDAAVGALDEMRRIELRSHLGREMPGYLPSSAADIAIASEDYEAGAYLVCQALREFQESMTVAGGDFAWLVAPYLVQLGYIALRRESTVLGISLMAASAALIDSNPGEGTWLFERSQLALASAKTGVPGAVFEKAWAMGRDMTEESSVAFALGSFSTDDASDQSFGELLGD